MPSNSWERETITLRADVVATVLEDGAVLLDLETKYFYLLNPTGWAIVQLFEAGATFDQVLKSCLAWGAPNGGDGVGRFVQGMVDEGLVGTSDTPSSPTPVEFSAAWISPLIEKQPEPLQKVMVSAFDPSMPLAE